jgi:hypothetical protein
MKKQELKTAKSMLKSYAFALYYLLSMQNEAPLKEGDSSWKKLIV